MDNEQQQVGVAIIVTNSDGSVGMLGRTSSPAALRAAAQAVLLDEHPASTATPRVDTLRKLAGGR